MLYHGLLCQVTLPGSPNQSMKPLSLQLSLSTPDGDISPFSEPVVIDPEQLNIRLKPPRELCVIGSTATHVRLCWIEPEGRVKPKSYQIYCNDTLLMTTTLLGWVRPVFHYNMLKVKSSVSIQLCHTSIHRG
jgi:hypothetical protein